MFLCLVALIALVFFMLSTVIDASREGGKKNFTALNYTRSGDAIDLTRHAVQQKPGIRQL